MDDYIEYMNALSATTSVNEQAQNAYESMLSYKDQVVEAKDDFKQQFAIIPELVLGGSGEFLLKEVGGKAISALTNSAKSGAKSLIKAGLKKAGVSEEDAEAMSESAVNGDIQGLASKTADVVTDAAGDIADQAVDIATNAAKGLSEIASDTLAQLQSGGDIVETLSGAVGRVGDVAATAAQQGSALADKAIEGVQNIGDAASGALEESGALAQGLLDQGTSLAGSALETAQGLAGGALETVQGLAGSALQTAQGLAGGALETAQGVAGSAVEAAQGLVGGAVDAAQGIAGGVVDTAADTMATVGDGIFANLQDSVLSMLSQQTRPLITNALLPEGAGTIVGQRSTLITSKVSEQYPLEEWSDETGALSRGNNLPSEFEMIDMSSRAPPPETPLPEGASSGVSSEIPITEPVATIPEATAPVAAEASAGAGVEAGTEIAVETGVDVGLEATGLALDATGILAPLGALVGLFAGLGGLLGLEKKPSLPPPPPPPAILNPSTNFGT